MPGNCWYKNIGKRPGDSKVGVKVEGLPKLAGYSQDKLDDPIRAYAQKTYDDEGRIRKLMPTAVVQVAYPIIQQGHADDGVLVPWGVLFIYSETQASSKDLDDLNDKLAGPNGIARMIEDVLARQDKGHMAHCRI